MGRDPFDSLVGISGGPEVAIIRQINLRQMQLQQSLGAYANHQIATPDIHIASRTTAFIPKVVGEDGQEMTAERRREMMKGKPTMVDLAAQGADPMDVGHYQDLFSAKDIGLEEMGTSAVANRQGFKRATTSELELASELLARQGLSDQIRDMSLCCYSAPYIGDGQALWSELSVAILKIRGLSPLNLNPEQLIMSRPIHALLSTWAGRDIGVRFSSMAVQISDRLKNEIRICATSSRPELSGRYASIFIDRPLYDEVNVDPLEDTTELPSV